MDRHLHALVGMALDQKPVLLAETQSDPAVHVDEAHAGTSLSFPGTFRQKLRRLFLGHAKTVVLDFQIDISVFFIAFYEDLALSVHVFHAVIDGIFQEGLKHQLHRTALLHLGLHLKFHLKGVFIADLLDAHVVLGVTDLILNAYDRLSAA